MTSVGHRTGLFDALADLPPSTPAAIAAAAGLEERYVREWLGAMATLRVVDHDPAAGTFSLPAAHVPLLCRRGGADNLATLTQYVGLLGSVEDDVVRCFREGGGVPYSRYGRFHEVMAEDSGQSLLPALEDRVLPLVPGYPERLERGERVLDLGCGRGRALLHLAARYPRSEFLGIDLSEEAVVWARARAAEAGLGNVRFEARDLSRFHEEAEPAAFGLVTTFDAVHDQAKPGNLLRGIRRTLRPDGHYLMQDIHGSSTVEGNMDHPLAPFLYTVSCMHCMTVSLAQGGDGLGAMWGRERAGAMLAEAGFGSYTVHRLEHDVQNAYWVVRPGGEG
ncbi:MAG: methyltransferase domain-containing protein [Planctomycetes bacterium]|nr:methyltransferase domain-containing protein [Planctomycetota bacterium]